MQLPHSHLRFSNQQISNNAYVLPQLHDRKHCSLLYHNSICPVDVGSHHEASRGASDELCPNVHTGSILIQGRTRDHYFRLQSLFSELNDGNWLLREFFCHFQRFHRKLIRGPSYGKDLCTSLRGTGNIQNSQFLLIEYWSHRMPTFQVHLEC